MEKKKLKTILWAIIGVIMIYGGLWIFFINTKPQDIILGFATSCMGALLFGWNMAYFKHMFD